MDFETLNRSFIQAIVARSSATIFAAGLATGLLVSPFAHANVLVDGSFETTQLPQGGYQYLDGTLNSWTYSGLAILIYGGDGSPWTSPSYQTGYDGDQVVGLQNIGSISQIFDSPGTGTFNLTWVDAGRSGYDIQNYTVSVFDNTVNEIVASQTLATPAGLNFQFESLFAELVANDNYTLTFQGLGSDPPGDATAFIDNVDLEAAPAPVPGVLPLSLWIPFFAGFVWLHRKRIRQAA